jgi:putative DNA primase/helicase
MRGHGGAPGGPSFGGPPDGGGGDPPILNQKLPYEGAHELVVRRFTDQAGRRTLHRQHKVYWRFAETHYVEVADEAVKAQIASFCSGARRQVFADGKFKLRPYGTETKLINNLEANLRSVTLLPEDLSTPCWLDPQPADPPPAELLVCANGVVHLPTGKFMPPNPRLFVQSALGVHYSPEADDPDRWLRFLDQLWPDDVSSQALLQEWFGYCLTADCSQHKAMLIVGPPRAGKGTIAHVLRAMLSPSSVTSMMMGDFDSEFGLWRLLGKQLAIIPDARVSGRSNTAAIVEKFLAITGGDVISVNRKSLRPVDAQLTARFMLLTNVVPQLADAAAALVDRMLTLSMDQSFSGREDRRLLPDLLQELPAILSWAIEGWHRLQAQGHFTEAKTASHVRETLEEASSPVRAFVRQCCDLVPGEQTERGSMFEAWRRWCAYSGRHPGSISTFGRNLRAACPGVTEGRPRTGGERKRVWNGIVVDFDRVPSADHKYSDRDEPPEQRSF